MIRLQIFRKLPFAALVIFISPPYFDFYNILPSMIIHDYICTSMVSGPGFDIIIPDTIYDRF